MGSGLNFTPLPSAPMTKQEVEIAIRVAEGLIAKIDTGVLIFGAFVALGVTGETVLGIAHWIKDRQLRNLRSIESQIHERELAEFRLKIANAEERASNADERATTAARDLAQANERAAEANAKA